MQNSRAAILLGERITALLHNSGKFFQWGASSDFSWLNNRRNSFAATESGRLFNQHAPICLDGIDGDNEIGNTILLSNSF